MPVFHFRLCLGIVISSLLWSAPDSLRAQHIGVVTVDLQEWKQEKRALRKEWRPKCRKVWSKRKNLNAVFGDPEYSASKLKKLASHFAAGNYGCRKTPALAVEILEELVGRTSPFTAEFSLLENLTRYHQLARGPDSTGRILELKRIRWLHGRLYGHDKDDIFVTEADRRAFIARDDVWAHLLKIEDDRYWGHRHRANAYIDPESPRFDAALGISLAEKWNNPWYKTRAAKLLLDGQHAATDLNRAEALLWQAGRSSDEARSLILSLVSSRLDGADRMIAETTASRLYDLGAGWSSNPSRAAIRDRISPFYGERLRVADSEVSPDAVRRLTRMAVTGSESASQELLPWLDEQLRDGNEAKRRSASNTLAALVKAERAGAEELLMIDIERSGGIAETRSMKYASRFSGVLMNADIYPIRASRDGKEAVVSVELLIAPGGHAIKATVKHSTDPSFDRGVTQTALRRVRMRFKEHPARYVRVTLPDVQFRHLGCEKDHVPTAKLPGAIVIEGTCYREQILV